MQPKGCKCGGVKNLDLWIKNLTEDNPGWTPEVLISVLSRHTLEECIPWGTPEEEEARRQNGN